MKKLLILGSLMAIATIASATQGWMTSWKDAAAMSKKTGKPVLVNFTGSDWCTWCHKLEGEVFATKDFKTWASKNVILLELDFPQAKKLPDALKKQNDDLSKKYKVEGFPTILFLDASGKELGRSGYMKGGPKAWLKNAEKFTAKKVKK